jgi:hypothetical protein
MIVPLLREYRELTIRAVEGVRSSTAGKLAIPRNSGHPDLYSRALDPGGPLYFDHGLLDFAAFIRRGTLHALSEPRGEGRDPSNGRGHPDRV